MANTNNWAGTIDTIGLIHSGIPGGSGMGDRANSSAPCAVRNRHEFLRLPLLDQAAEQRQQPVTHLPGRYNGQDGKAVFHQGNRPVPGIDQENGSAPMPASSLSFSDHSKAVA